MEYGGSIYPPGRLHHLELVFAKYGIGTMVSEIPVVSSCYFNKAIENSFKLNSSGLVVKSRSNVDNSSSGSDIPVVKLFYSFRSPYSQLVIPRLKTMCDNFGAKIEICPMMPMVLRGLSVLRIKELYIATDAIRESKLWGINFGMICDPGRSYSYHYVF